MTNEQEYEYQLMEDQPPNNAKFLSVSKVHLEPIYYAHFQTPNGCFHQRLIPKEFADLTVICERKCEEFIEQATFRLVRANSWHWKLKAKEAE